MMSWIFALGNWLYSNVLGNLVASVLWATPAFIWHHRRLTRQHEKSMQSIHARLDSLSNDGADSTSD